MFYNLNLTTGNVLPSCHTVDLCDFDTSTKAAGSTPCSFDSINNDFFAGRMKPLAFCRFVVDLKIFFDNMIRSRWQMDLQFKDAIRVYQDI